MNTLFLDTETFSPTPIKNGAHAYAEAAEVILVAWAWNDEPVEVWDTQDIPDWREALQGLIYLADRVVIHNSHFDRTVLRHCGVNIPVEKVTDTMVQALQHSLPASLGQLCDALDVPVDKAKDKDGKKLIQLFTKPRPSNHKLRRATRETHPDEWDRFIEYARLDVDAMRYISRRLPSWNADGLERDLWLLDQRINDRGVAVDREFARAALRAFERASRSLAHATVVLTDGAFAKATQRDRVIGFMADRGIGTVDLTKATVEKLLRDDSLPPDVRDMLEIRQQAAATSPSKYKTLLAAASSDGRLRGTVQFCGASRTGRDAGRLFQPQNLPRTPDWFDDEVQDFTIRAMKADCEDLIWANVSERCSMSVRGCLVAASGNKLCIADLSNIEGRVLAWLAGEEWKIEAFKAYDRGDGPDLYKVTAGRILGKDAKDVTKDERQNPGKTYELSCGFGGSVGAVRKMGGRAIEAMSDDTILAGVQAWRKVHPATRSFWYDVEGAARNAIRDPEGTFGVRGLVHFDSIVGPDEARYIRCRLPSGRYLSYRSMHITEDGVLLYEGINQYTRKWEWLETYYGKLCIAGGTLVLTDAGWLPIEHVTSEHRLWDGVEWVRNEGLVRKGVKEVICLNGVWMTPDHEVLAREGWVRASQSEGLERADPRIPDGYGVPGLGRTPVTVVAPLRVRQGCRAASGRYSQAAEEERSGVVRLHAPGDHRREEDDARDVAPQGVCGVAEHAGPLPASDASGLAQLRRAGYRGLRTLARLFFGFLGGHGPDVPRGPDAGAPRQFRRIQPAELRMGYAFEASAEQATERARQHAVGQNDSGGSSGSGGVEPDDVVLPREQRGAGASAFRGSRHIAEVYDLVNCGPRNRFVVAGETGETFIVHNCENVVQAVARDVFMVGLRRAEGAGYAVVLRVHDELVCEVPDTSAFTHTALAGMMSENPSWSLGLPLAAAGFETLRYRKE